MRNVPIFHREGNIVKLTDGNGNNLTEFAILGRGYTGHEHLSKVGLIHMNGRLYDPLLHRFLSPDNYVQDPSNTQNYNRYGYVLNNPLSHIDPSGEFAFLFLVPILGKAIATLVTAAIIGAGVGAVTYTASVALSSGGFNNWNWGQFAKSVGIGAVSGVVTSGIGSVFGDVGKFGHELLRGLAHGFSNGGISELTGGSFLQGFASGALGSLAGSGFQAVGKGFAQTAVGTIGFSAVAGGVGAELTGGEFWKGAVIGATVAGLNHLAHNGPKPRKSILENVKETVNEAFEFAEDFAGGVGDFMETYDEMIDANWKNSDKYFHSKANFKASLRGPGGAYAAEKLSNLREITDQRIKFDSRASSVADQKANFYGRSQASKVSNFNLSNSSYGKALPLYRPINLPPKY